MFTSPISHWTIIYYHSSVTVVHYTKAADFTILLLGLLPQLTEISKVEYRVLNFFREIQTFIYKINKTNKYKTVRACQKYFSFKLPNIQLPKRKSKRSKSETNFTRPLTGISVVSISIYLFTVSEFKVQTELCC